MATLNIEGKKVTVDDSFLSLSPAEQERTVEEIAGQLRIEKPNNDTIMGHVNRGIAGAVGGVVDLVNPFDKPHDLNPFPQGTGSAVTGLSNLMRSGGIDVAEGDPDNMLEGFARGTGEAAASLVPAAKLAQLASKGGGVVASLADDAYRSLTATGGATAEVVAGGISEAAQTGAEQAGAPEWVQDTAGILAPMSYPAAIATTRQALKVTPGGQAVRRLGPAVSATIAPYTRSGGREVARQRMQSLAGGPERASELASRVEGETALNLTPAQQTDDQNMRALEQLAAEQDPALRGRLETRAKRGDETARREIGQLGEDVDSARMEIRRRQERFASGMKEAADHALERADARIRSVGGQLSESENALIVTREINRALSQSLEKEASLWNAVPKGAQVSTSESRNVAQSILQETPRAQRNDIPQVVMELLAGDSGFGDAETVAEMHGLYSELRRLARSAMAGNDQNKNRARIANTVADAILKDLGATGADTDIGKAINEARSFSAALHETFDRGAVGRLLKRTLDGDTSIDPELSLSRTVGRGGVEGAVGARQIKSAVEGDQTSHAIEDYIKDRFQTAAVDPSGQFTSANARRFFRDNLPLLEQYPDLRVEILGAIANRESADQVSQRVAKVIQRSNAPSKSVLADFLDGPPEKAINAVLSASNPVRAANNLRNAVRRDKTGMALDGLKGAFATHLIRGAGGKSGNINPQKMSQLMNDRQFGRAMARIFEPAEIGRLRRISAELSKLHNTEAGNIGSSLSGAKANRAIEYAARVIAARQGADLGGGGGGSIQTAQMASSRVKDMLNRLASDKASQILADAVEDPDLFRALLTDLGSIEAEKRVTARLLPYLVGGAASTATD